MDYIKYPLSPVEENTLAFIYEEQRFLTADEFDEDDAALISLVTLGYVRPFKRPKEPDVVYIMLTDHGLRRYNEIGDPDGDEIERPH